MTFPAAELQLEFMDPAEDGDGGSMFPTGKLVDDRRAGRGHLQGHHDQLRHSHHLPGRRGAGLHRRRRRTDINGDAAALARFEAIRAHGALRMGLICRWKRPRPASTRPVAFVARPRDYVTSSGKKIGAGDVDVLVRALSMGKLHHAMMGTASVAIATAAAVPGTLVNLAAGGGERDQVCFGHPRARCASARRRSWWTENGRSPRPS